MNLNRDEEFLGWYIFLRGIESVITEACGAVGH